ncbi:MAG: hypothetical protein H7X70_04785 [Candidatus Kapabacteria bacterium]|nr:hypothetical protein [Candidatus Kapabacteria bacterium]
MLFSLRCISLVLLLLVAAEHSASGQSRGKIVFQEWFPSKQPDSAMLQWSLRQGHHITVPRISKSPRGIRLLGPFDVGDALRLTMKDLPRHSLLRIELGWHIIGPWQGAPSNDRFMAMVDGRSVIDATFSNTTAQQSWPASAGARALPPRTQTRNCNVLGYECSYTADYVGPMDATYETVSTIEHIASTATFDVTALFVHFMLDTNRKQWALDHVVFTVLDPYTESELPSKAHTPTPAEVVVHDGQDMRELAEFVQDGHFPNIASTSALARELHVTYLQNECLSCGDVCLMYNYRLYTDGWLSVWSNSTARGKATFCTLLDAAEFDSVSKIINQCAAEPLKHAYHDQAYEEAHPDLTHCELVMIVDDKESKTEIYAGEPPALRQLMAMVMTTLEKRGWVPIPK